MYSTTLYMFVKIYSAVKQSNTCPILLTTDVFSRYMTGEQFKMVITASCKSSNITYIIVCRRCGQHYMGETGQPLHCRINGHCYDIMHRRMEECLMVAHFKSNTRS